MINKKYVSENVKGSDINQVAVLSRNLPRGRE
jgi:hypothetical protein